MGVRKGSRRTIAAVRLGKVWRTREIPLTMLETHVPDLVTVSRQAVVQALPSSSCPGAPMFGLVRHTSHRRWD